MAWLHTVIDLPSHAAPRATRFWRDALGWPLGAPWQGQPERRSLNPPGADPYIHLQEVFGPARVHFDVESSHLPTTVAAALAAGADTVAFSEHWVALRSPGGLPFSVVPAHPRRAPATVHWPSGYRSRLVEVCVDAPRARHEREVAFWRRLLTGRWVESSADGFAGIWHDDEGSPVQLLFQRLDEPDGPVRCHLDLATNDQRAEVRRLLTLGAEDVGPGPGGWHMLRDPAGLTFWVSEIEPQQASRHDAG
ncbi:VOC family protein [Oryzobacter terrae]|uniref:VOC family protein n=1 Tax=Oryzobacter terrae TaxID=1620385 RepID=UPI00367107AF